MSREERRERRRFKQAYAEAWAHRRRTGDGSDDVLLAALEAHAVHLGRAHDLILDIWRRGTPPHAVNDDALAHGLVLAEPVAHGFDEIARHQEGPQAVPLVDLPGGRERVSKGADWHMHAPPVVYDKAATSYLASLDLPLANSRTGELAAQVWLLPREEPPLCDLMLGEVSIGTARLPDPAWQRLRAQEQENRFADGIVFCWPVSDGVLEPDALRCVLPD